MSRFLCSIMLSAKMFQLRTLEDMTNTWLKTALQDAGKNQNDLVTALGINHTQVSKTVNGPRLLQPREFIPTANLLGISLDELLNGLGYGVAKSSSPAAPPSAQSKDMRIAFLQELYADGIALPGETLSSMIEELDSFCSQETDIIKLGMKAGELMARARSQAQAGKTKRKKTIEIPDEKSEDNLEDIFAEQFDEALNARGWDMPADKKAKAVSLALKIFERKTQEIDTTAVIEDVLKAVN